MTKPQRNTNVHEIKPFVNNIENAVSYGVNENNDKILKITQVNGNTVEFVPNPQDSFYGWFIGSTKIGKWPQKLENNVEIEAQASCFAKGTKISMADGTHKNIEDIIEGDIVLAFNHEEGCFVPSTVYFTYSSDTQKKSFTLTFDNGATLSIIGGHDLFEQESNKYVTISQSNAQTFIGKHFYSADKGGYVRLDSVVYDTEAVDYYTIYTQNTINCIANGMLNVAEDTDYLLNIYKFDDNLKADLDVLASDIDTYGEFEYSDEYGPSFDDFQAWNSKYLNVVVGKGLLTWDQIFNQYAEVYGF